MPTRVKLVILALFVAGIGAFVAASLAGGSDRPCRPPAAIEQLIPECNAQVLQQDRVGVDMRPGYTAELAINGVPIPNDEIRSIGVAANQQTGVAPDTFVFTPGRGKALEELQAQQNCATVTYWSLADGPDRSSQFTWCFRAA